MKKKYFKQICGLVLITAMLITMLPGTLAPVQAADEAKWVHMSDDEKATGMASYDAEKDTISFKTDAGWGSRMKYTGISDVSGKDYAIEFDLNVNGGAIGVYNYDDSGVLYGVYLDIGAAALDALQFTDWITCADDFWFREATTPGATAHPQTPCSNWNAGDNAGSRLKVEFIRGEGGGLAGGTVNYYKKDSSTGTYLKLGSLTIPSNVANNTNLANHFGIQLWLGEGTVSNITVTALTSDADDNKPGESAKWLHMSDDEKATGMASYDVKKDTISFKTDAGWSSRMKYIGISDVSGKDYAIEFDLNVTGGAIGVYNYEDSGVLYGAYLDTGSGGLDALQFSDWITCVDDFWFREATTPGATVHPQTPCSNWNAGDNAGSRLKVEFIRGEGGTLAGGTVTYYKKDNGTGKYLTLGSLTIPSDVADNSSLANHFGIQLWLGEGTVSNITVTEITSDNTENPKWVHMSDEEKALGTASYDVKKDTISFKTDAGWGSRMKYTGISDVSGKDYAIEFDLNVNGGAIGVYNYDDSGVLYGVYLDIGAAALDALQFTDWITCLDDFCFRETTGGTTVHPQTPCSNWNAGDNAGSRLKVEFIRGEGGGLAGGTVNYYKKDSSTGTYLKLGSLTIPSNVANNTNLTNHFGIQLWLGEGTVSNITVTEINAGSDGDNAGDTGKDENASWLHMSNDEKALGMATYDTEKNTISFKTDAGWSSRMKYIGLAAAAGKDYVIEFDLNVSGGEIGVYSFEATGALYGVYLDTAASALDALQFSDWVTCQDDFYFRESTTDGATVHSVVQAQNWNPASDMTGTRIRVEYSCGKGGTLAGGTVTYYKKNGSAGEYYLLGSVSIPDSVKDDPNLDNYFGIQLWLGEGTVSNISISEKTVSGDGNEDVKVHKNPKWMHLSEVEKEVGDASYNESTDTITFSGTAEGWSSRLINTEIEDLSGENFAVEFDAELGSAGAIGITPYYDDAEHFYSVYYDLAGMRLDGVGINGFDSEGNLIILDDFAYIDNTIYPCFPLQNLSPTYGEDVRIRIECFLGKGGTMAGGTAHFYFKRQGFSEWTRLGVVTMPDTIEDNADVPNKLMIHGRLVNGTVSNVSVIRNITKPVLDYKVTESSQWKNVSDYEKLIGAATFNDATGKMTLSSDSGWASRMICLTVPDVTGKAFALEFNADFGVSGGALGVIPFYEDADNWYGVYIDRGSLKIDGAGYMQGKIIDDFDYIDTTLYSSLQASASPIINQIRYRFEYFPNGDGLASGAVCRLYYKQMPGGKLVDDTWRLIGEFTMPDTLVDRPETANKIMISARLLCATLSDISYTEIDPDTETEYYNGPEDYEFEDGYPEDDYQAVTDEAETPQKRTVPWWSIVMIVVGAGALIALASWKFIIPAIKKRKQN